MESISSRVASGESKMYVWLPKEVKQKFTSCVLLYRMFINLLVILKEKKMINHYVLERRGKEK